MKKAEITKIIRELKYKSIAIQAIQREIIRLHEEKIEIFEIDDLLEEISYMKQVKKIRQYLALENAKIPIQIRNERQELKYFKEEYGELLDKINGERLTKLHGAELENIFKIMDNIE